MSDSSVVDTNVLIVASAAHESSPFCSEDTPVDDPNMRREVLQWLIAFAEDKCRIIVLDYGWEIRGEYSNKLSVQDYGWLTIMDKVDRQEVAWIELQLDKDGNAVLPDSLASAVTDLADRKMVAAAINSISNGHSCTLVNACDTDWLDCAEALIKAKINSEHLLKDWLHEKWYEKHKKKNKNKK